MVQIGLRFVFLGEHISGLSNDYHMVYAGRLSMS